MANLHYKPKKNNNLSPIDSYIIDKMEVLKQFDVVNFQNEDDILEELKNAAKTCTGDYERAIDRVAHRLIRERLDKCSR